MGALLLWGAWAVGRSISKGRFSQLVALGERDPSGVDARIVVSVKALLFGLAIAGLVVALRTEPREAR